MSKVAVVDVASAPDSEFSGDKLIRKVSMILDRAGEVGEPIYVIDSLNRNNMSATTLQSDGFKTLNKQIRFLNDTCVPAALYTVKQDLDRRNLSSVVVITPCHRRTVLQKYQELLFTTLYNFVYINNDRPISDDSSAGDGASEEIVQVSDDVATFVRQLPAIGEISVLQSPLVPGCFSHGFTTRTGGISYIRTLSSLNLFSSSKRRDPQSVVRENIRRLGLKVGFQPHQFHMVKVDHASDVWVVGDHVPEGMRYDGMVTNQADVVLAAPGADCMPLLFSDPVAKAIGVAHAGWKGTLMGIAMATVNAMVSRFGSKPENIVAVIGPSVGDCCFRLDQGSAKEFQSIHPDCVREDGTPRPYVNIRLATRIPWTNKISEFELAGEP
ncbi:purine nucleoside phosphorylase LACC1 isoform X2 [Engraulis encrasicolus]|uniref:purine nucleoside phosphorylase LACC1 isoform X2 n=1 Tax=Engraulis encrasicolus TaxID=184585 RepID=UPI002FD59135